MRALLEIKQQIENIQKSFAFNHSLLTQFNNDFKKVEQRFKFLPCNPAYYDFFLPYQRPNFPKGTTAKINRYIDNYIVNMSLITKFFTQIYLPMREELSKIEMLISSLERALADFKELKFSRSDEVFYQPNKAATVVAEAINEVKIAHKQLREQFLDVTRDLIESLIIECEKYQKEEKQKTYYSRIYMRQDENLNKLFQVSMPLVQQYRDQQISVNQENYDELSTRPLVITDDDDYENLAYELALKMDKEQFDKENMRPNFN